MHQDVIDLRSFYYRTKLGRSAQVALQDALRTLWPNTKGMVVVGFGFAVPVLRPFLRDSQRVLAFMPDQQGVMPWPPAMDNVTTLVHETRWPVPAGSVDRLVVAHGLETCESPQDLLTEIWRVLSPGGHVVFVVPNRSGLWARTDATPFGNGRPYSFGQLESLLRKCRFSPEHHEAALYFPPSHGRFWQKTAKLWEKMGRRYNPQMVAGALLVEAAKNVHPGSAENPSRLTVPGPLEVLEGLAGSKPKPLPGNSFAVHRDGFER
ncbi:class I SAM-dependent methyltransferase [Amaricoccus tamworthensis]|uniref:class I SAM-dependent methyltransferase n=1 Tax=Amaricoccus tamworthensis TaxID=57002 RepID=UPI003C7C3591